MNIDYKIDVDIYNEDILKVVIKDFQDVGKMVLDQGIISIEGDSKEEIEEVFNEFMNYCIGLINEQ